MATSGHCTAKPGHHVWEGQVTPSWGSGAEQQVTSLLCPPRGRQCLLDLGLPVGASDPPPTPQAHPHSSPPPHALTPAPPSLRLWASSGHRQRAPRPAVTCVASPQAGGLLASRRLTPSRKQRRGPPRPPAPARHPEMGRRRGMWPQCPGGGQEGWQGPGPPPQARGRRCCDREESLGSHGGANFPCHRVK